MQRALSKNIYHYERLKFQTKDRAIKYLRPLKLFY